MVVKKKVIKKEVGEFKDAVVKGKKKVSIKSKSQAKREAFLKRVGK